MGSGQGKYPIDAITDWDKEIKKHIPIDEQTENKKDDFGEFVLSLQSEDFINTSSSSGTTYDSITIIDGDTHVTNTMNSQDTLTITHDDLFSFHDNIETYEDRTERRLDAIEKRLCILEPKHEMIKKYTVLQDLYNQYRAAEALLYGNDSDENEENN